MSIPRPFPFLRRLALFSLALALPLAFSACGGGNDSGNGSSDGSAPYDHKPAFDCSGSWATTFDGVYLGTTVFNMARDGKLTGTMKLANGESGNLNGHLAAHQADFQNLHQLNFIKKTKPCLQRRIISEIPAIPAHGVVVEAEGAGEVAVAGEVDVNSPWREIFAMYA